MSSDYRSIWDTIVRRRAAVLVVLAVGLLVLPFALRVLTTTYSGTAHILLVNEQTQREPLVKPKDLTTLATSSVVLQRVRDELGLSETIAQLQSQTRVQVAEDSNVMPITFRSHSSDLAVTVPNAIANEVVNGYRDLSTRQYGRLTQRLRSQLAEQRMRMLQIEAQYQSTVTKNAFTGDEQSLDGMGTQLSDLYGQRDQAAAVLERDAAQGGAATRRSPAATGIIQQQVLDANPQYRDLQGTAAADAARLAFEQAQYSKRYPGLPGLQDQVARETGFVKREQRRLLATEVDYDRARLAAIDQQISAARERIVDLSQAGVSAEVLRAQRAAAEATYQAVSNNLGQAMANEAEAASLGSVVVIDRATSATSLFGSVKKRVALGFIVILALAVSSAFILESVEPRLDGIKQVERTYGRPLLGSLRAQ